MKVVNNVLTLNYILLNKPMKSAHFKKLPNRSMLGGGLVIERVNNTFYWKNLSKSMSGKDMGIPIYFPWLGKQHSHTLGNLWKLVSHIRELCGFLTSIDFYSKPIVWEYISFPDNVPIVWNFTLPILCGLSGFPNNF